MEFPDKNKKTHHTAPQSSILGGSFPTVWALLPGPSLPSARGCLPKEQQPSWPREKQRGPCEAVLGAVVVLECRLTESTCVASEVLRYWECLPDAVEITPVWSGREEWTKGKWLGSAGDVSLHHLLPGHMLRQLQTLKVLTIGKE